MRCDQERERENYCGVYAIHFDSLMSILSHTSSRTQECSFPVKDIRLPSLSLIAHCSHHIIYSAEFSVNPLVCPTLRLDFYDHHG